MRLYFLNFIISIFCLLLPLPMFSQGLKFNGNECPIDSRTSYYVFSENIPTFSDYLNITFDISISEPSRIGYILRIRNQQKSNKTYNISFDGQGENAVFKFNEEGRTSLITAILDKEEYQSSQWFKVSISFDLKEDSLFLKFNESEFKYGNLELKEIWNPLIYFGKSEHVIDVPSFSIRNLSISDNHKQYFFPLKENEGTEVYDIQGNHIGEVINPVWLINDAYYWKYKTNFKSNVVSGANINQTKEEIYFFNNDSLISYDIRTGDITSRQLNNNCPMDIQLGTSFIDESENKLYAYEVVRPESGSEVTMVYLDLNNNTWTEVCSDFLPIQLHHHSAYLDKANKRYILFGGFGNLRYNKDFYSFDLSENRWDKLLLEGDIVFPRYFSSMGYNEKNNSLYIFGGMGNESGDQVVGRRYFYDLHKVDLNTKQITKLWEITWDKDNVVPVRSMIILDDSCFYTLCYPEHFSDSFLRLYRFSIEDGSYRILGDSIPIHSDKIKTNANLYYSHRLNELYTIVQEFEGDDIASNVKIYSLSFPPVTLEELRQTISSDRTVLYRILFFIVLLSAIGTIYVYKRHKKKPASKNSEQKDVIKEDNSTWIEKRDKPNAIYLFGEFTVKDKQNKDITYMFSAQLKQAFFVILEYSIENGISSQRLGELLWPDKREDKVKNSRGVTINHLRKVLNEIDGIQLMHEKGYFKIIFTNECYCDLARYMEIISSDTTDQNREELSEILIRGKFLQSENLDLFDSFKSQIEAKTDPVLQVEIEKNYKLGHYRTTISLAKAIFYIDPINDNAIYFMVQSFMKLKMESEAKKRYLLFAAEYRKMMGEDYPHSFSHLIYK